MIHLLDVALRPPEADAAARFPFNVPAIAALAAPVRFTTPVTILVGENGSGKSTLLEALALAIGAITVGSQQAANDPSLAALRPLADRLQLGWTRKTRRGFFLRSEDFFGYARQMQTLRTDFEAEMRRIDADPSLPDLARSLAKLPFGSEAGALRRRYGDGLDTVSHGESFLALMQARFVPNGLYLLDEPEAPLSPMRQLALVALINRMVATQGAQYLIATHAPIVMAVPGATILACDQRGLRPTAFADVEHVQLLRAFLAHPEQYLQHLAADEP